MQNNIPLIFLFFSSMITENLIFARAIGIEEINNRTSSIRKIVLHSLIVLFICLPSVLISYPVKYYLLGAKNWIPVRGLVVVLAVCLCYLVEDQIFRKKNIYKKYGISHSSALYLSVSCTSVAAVLYSLQFTSILRCIVYVAGSCIGVMFAMLLLRSGKERLEFSNVSKAFQGLPITLIYIGILSMAIYGLVGHKLLA